MIQHRIWLPLVHAPYTRVLYPPSLKQKKKTKYGVFKSHKFENWEVLESAQLYDVGKREEEEEEEEGSKHLNACGRAGG